MKEIIENLSKKALFESLALRRMLVLNKSASLRSAETSIRLGKYAERIDFLNINKIEIGETLKLQPCVMGVRAKPLAKSPIYHNGKKEFLDAVSR